MAPDSKPKDLFDFDLPEGLDKDLGGDWESAFQAEDFMLSPEGDDFLGQENAQDINLASILEDSEETKTGKASATTFGKTINGISGNEQAPATAPRFSFPSSALIFLARIRDWYKIRPPFQKILLPAVVGVALIGITSVLFFRSTTDQLARHQPLPQEGAPSQPVSPPTENPISLPTGEPLQAQIAAAAPDKPDLPQKNRKKWAMPGFFITVEHDQSNETAIISVDLTLILLLDPGQPLPEQKKAYVRDTIYQFYNNRPVDELRHYALARGEMIRNLESWLKKAWPDGPVASIIFDRYRVIR
ncbi:MAG: hypothetical protein V1706_04240 [Pseudomonadota bacterium]